MRTCVFCKYFILEYGVKSYFAAIGEEKETTIACAFNFWRLTWFSDADNFRKKIQTAATCKEFVNVTTETEALKPTKANGKG